MTLTEIKSSPNYAPIVIRVPELQKLPNSDRLYGIGAAGITAAVDSSWLEREGQLALLFPAEAQISEGLARFANLHRHAELNDNPEESGYLEDHRRVRAMKLRGNVSKGLMLPWEVVKAYVSMMAEPPEVSAGDSFDTLNGVELSRKYVAPTKPGSGLTKAQAAVAKAFKRVTEKVFPAHIETTFFLRNEDKVAANDIMIVTQKLHGTSVRFGNVPVKVKHTFWERLAAKVGIRVPEYEFALIGGSRKVIKDPGSETQNHYYSHDVWSDAAQFYGQSIPKGFIVYGELVGFVNGSPIQSGFTYGILPDVKPSLFVYRVARVNEDGVMTDLSWDQVKEFSRAHGLQHTPELWRGPKAAFSLDTFVEAGYRELYETALAETGHQIYPDRPVGLSEGGTGKDEGFVVRVDKGGEVPDLYKVKNDSFYVFESGELDKGEENLEA